MNKDFPHDDQIARAERVEEHILAGLEPAKSLKKVADEGNVNQRTVRRALKYQEGFRLIPTSVQADVAQRVNEKEISVKDVQNLSGQSPAQVQEALNKWMQRAVDVWGYQNDSGAASINAVLLAADTELSEHEIAAKIRELGLPERDAIANHLWQLKEKRLVTKTPSGRFVRTSEPFAPLDVDVAAPEDSAITEPYTPDKIDRRRLVQRTICERRGQQQFRDALRNRYGDRCMVTGCQTLAVLEAAHINPYRGENDNHIENGLLLRADIHTLFDLDLLGIEPIDLQVELHPGIETGYASLAGKRLFCPAYLSPSQEQLAIRYQSFCERKRQTQCRLPSTTASLDSVVN